MKFLGQKFMGFFIGLPKENTQGKKERKGKKPQQSVRVRPPPFSLFWGQ